MAAGWHPSRGPTRRAARRGLTLVEVLITLTIVALLVGAVIIGPGMVTGARQRGAATLVVAATRFAMTRANTTGFPIRIVFDLEQQRISMEQGSSTQFLREKPPTGVAKSDAEAAGDIEKAATAEADRIVKGPTIPRPTFQVVKEFEGDDGKPGEGRSLGKGVKFVQVQTERDDEPVTEGRAYLYFWPRIGTERASIQIAREGEGEGGVTVLVSALTGRAKIERGLVDLPEGRGTDGDYSEREEP